LPLLEAELCRRADLVIATSETLCQDRQQYNANTHWVPNGADVEHFARPSPIAYDLHALKRPLIGFIGGLSQWVDVDLLGQLAAARPDWTFVLVGPVSVDVSALRARSNVHMLGPRPYAHLPAYLAGMDVALIPFRHEPVTYHADPIKAYEYLAAGVPVVATNLPALARLEHVVRLADTPADFERQIGAALAEGRGSRRAERQTEAQHHSWSSRFAQIESLIHAACQCAS
jgi:O-antigen biosynthesis protein